MKEDYVIITDSACDIPERVLKEWNVQSIRMPFMFTDNNEERLDGDMPLNEFYNEMRNGRIVKTSGVNEFAFEDVFEKALAGGKDILYVSFSSGLSVTYNNGRLVADELKEKYPDRKIYVVDSLSASAGEGLLVYKAFVNREKGISIEENAKSLDDEKLSICHWFTVGDLVYLKRGGRISAATAIIGGALDIKPILHVDNDGHLIKMSQARGRKKSIQTLADKLKETIIDDDTPIFISHGDCEEDAIALKDIIKNYCGKEVKIITYIGSLIGAHSGPGTLALFFKGTNR